MTLVPYRGNLLAQTREWTGLHDDELRRRAVQAAGEKDVDALVSLTTAYLAHQGGSGVLTSPRTVEAYGLGTRQFALYAREQAVNLLRPHWHDAQNYVNHLKIFLEQYQHRLTLPRQLRRRTLRLHRGACLSDGTFASAREGAWMLTGPGAAKARRSWPS